LSVYYYDPKSNKILAYAIDFVSFTIQNLKTEDIEKIKCIVLFGSVARNDHFPDSDVDLFIEYYGDSNKLSAKLDKFTEKFYVSSKVKKYWKLLGIDNDFSCKIGSLDDYESLVPALTTDGILLYGKFKPQISNGQYCTLFAWENIPSAGKRTVIHRKIFGYQTKNKKYQGLIDEFNGKRIGKGTVLFPTEHHHHILDFFREQKIVVKIYSFIQID